MAQTLWQISKPAFNNAVINTLPLVLWSSNRTEPQFKYVLDVYYYGDTTRLTRVKFANNNSFNDGAGVIDLAPIIQSYLSYDQPWKNTESTFSDDNAKQFTFVAGEEFATTTSSSAQIYDGDGSVGEPAYTASENNLFLAVNEFDAGSYDWDYAVYATSSLTNSPYGAEDNPKIVYNGDYETISFIDNSYETGNNILISNVTASVYNGATLLHSDTFNPGVSPLPNTKLVRYVGIGPGNLTDTSAAFSSSLTSSWTDIVLEVTGSYSGSNYSRSYYYKNGDCSFFDVQRFAFINKLGTWDYHNIDLPFTKNTKITRKSLTKTHLQYQEAYGVQFGSDPELVRPIYKSDSRGLSDYYMQPVDRFSIVTDWLNESEANWLTEMIDSPNVYTQISGSFYPINITKANYNWKTNPRGQKIFQYDFTYEFSNQRFSLS